MSKTKNLPKTRSITHADIKDFFLYFKIMSQAGHSTTTALYSVLEFINNQSLKDDISLAIRQMQLGESFKIAMVNLVNTRKEVYCSGLLNVLFYKLSSAVVS